ncbi:hypothetical protein FHT79_003451 [Rhizobium sp. BK212]|uniref:hypothetical protein n=1 Tax=Rhizobium sp. BK212 TaxID=2587074 RepID=UPI00161640F4|nr:hypothetical protein [Rhizobium sp. BK212]MBB4216264.1 hypothetical protein [Rhizobium sp. BK212]
MVQIKNGASTFELWQAAIRSSLGFISSYLAPDKYDMNDFYLSDRPLHLEENFSKFIRSRIELSRSVILSSELSKINYSELSAFRHEVYYGRRRVEGAIILPRLIRERAAGRLDTIPVLRTVKNSDTPEALFISELIQSSTRVCRWWKKNGGSEGRLAGSTLKFFNALENQAPWDELRTKPRPSLPELVGIVRSRLAAGWSKKGGIIDRLLKIVDAEGDAVSEAAGDIAFFISNDPRYQDRMFELICLGWLVSAARNVFPSFKVHEENFLSARGPIATFCKGERCWSLSYQRHYASETHYHWRGSRQRLRAIPDYVAESILGGNGMTVILDAKNRPQSSRSEIIYKMLGYKENLRLKPFAALALAPTYEKAAFHRVDDDDGNSVGLVYLPLDRGELVLRRILRSVLDTSDRNKNMSRP